MSLKSVPTVGQASRSVPILIFLLALTVGCAASPIGKKYQELVASIVKEGESIDTELSKLYKRDFQCYPVRGKSRAETGEAMSCVRNVSSLLPPHGCLQWIKLVYSDATGRVEKIDAHVACASL